jgi:phosphoadenosine phosphosulfate reductase
MKAQPAPIRLDQTGIVIERLDGVLDRHQVLDQHRRFDQEKIERLKIVSEEWSAERVLAWAFDTFGDQVAISTALGSSGMVVIDLASRVRPNFRVFTLDTDFLFPETHHLMRQVEKRYGITIENLRSALSPEEQSRAYGPELWLRNPDQCCHLRKVEPLRRKLAELQGWITSIRRDQTSERANAGKIEWDTKFGMVKINPLADWTSDRVWQHIRDHGTPYNSLHDFNYPSIGCTHCTRAVSPGEDERAGRWAGLGKTECGLHIIEPAPGPPQADF